MVRVVGTTHSQTGQINRVDENWRFIHLSGFKKIGRMVLNHTNYLSLLSTIEA